MRKAISLLLCILALSSFALLSGCGNDDGLVLNVYNWGESISDGSEGSLDTVAEFERWYEETNGVPVTVNYTTYDSNENLYNKLANGAVSYDLIIPSDYMIAKLIEEDMLAPINFDNIPNYKYITDNFRNLYYDPNNEYSIPYTYGCVGVIYNAKVVDPADAADWDLMWNEKYAGQILQFNNPRDAFGTAMYKEGIDVNTTDHADWDKAQAELVRQNPLLKGRVMDEIYNMMASGEAAIGTYYAGDYFTMVDMSEGNEDSVDLKFYYPERTNYFVDAMCIPANCQNKELAECFINFMLSQKIAVANAEKIYYASPNSQVYEDPSYQEYMGEEAMEILYMGLDTFQENYNKFAFRSLDQETLDYVNSLWEKIKLN